ncbi:MAG: phosphohydrolase [endosymbiont of Galathealinum brachiosum]|uniref:Phosphohydrolase n=1 Tax=endosymbiont of Galathealinum brachiosum TaxID=2200906 RepID=A0A370DMN4_9GAMM|nr:MAG: phosphohydrolase [endosymbiont of Galathealinum brachiosum]
MISKIELLNEIGIALSAEKNSQKVLELILDGAKKLTNADGGSLYTLNDKDELVFEIVSTDSLDIHMGGTTGQSIDFPPLPLHIEGHDNLSMVVTSAVLNDNTINIHDAYHADGFDFSGTRKFDENTGYRTKSLLTIPMKNHKADIIGVLQLINSTSIDTGVVVDFSSEDQKLAESLASQAAVALTNKKLIDEQKALFEAFIKLIATAIDEKSPYTGGHCKRLPELTMMIADACDKDDAGALKDFKMTEKDRYELMIAGWLHDCGKVTTPEYVIDKSTKLETIYDRINTVNARFEVLKRDAKISMLEKQMTARETADEQAFKDAERDYEALIEKLNDDKEFISVANVGGEYMAEDKQERVREIAKYKIDDCEEERCNFFNEDEIQNLTIAKGTLTNEERQVINNHIVVTIKMLDQLPFPKHLENVPEYAGGHHERMDGKGYPKGLTRDQMSWPARMMGIADIFEALTARDRPYKDGKKLSVCLDILGKMRLDNHIDPEIFDVFVREKVYMEYASEFLTPDQIDEVDHSKIPGFSGD